MDIWTIDINACEICGGSGKLQGDTGCKDDFCKCWYCKGTGIIYIAENESTSQKYRYVLFTSSTIET